MTILDRHIAQRYLANFILLFAVLFLFAVSIDAILNLDKFTAAATRVAEERGSDYWWMFLSAIVDFHGPRIFQLFAYMLGLVSVGAAGFTLSQMVRARELVAIMAAGASLHRVALVIVACATGLNLLQLLNQELMLPRLAPYLIREHEEILKGSLNKFEVQLTRDGRGQLLRAASLDPTTGVVSGLVLIERDEKGTATARTEATSATWNAARGAYDLVGGLRFRRQVDGAAPRASTDAPPRLPGEVVGGETVERVVTATTDLSPVALKIRRYQQYAQMLSLRQIRDMRAQGGVDPRLLSRLTYLRLGSIAVNLLVLVAALPFFLLREPASLLQQSVRCALFAVPGTLGAFVAMTIDTPGLAPAVSVFLPAAILVPIALWRVDTVKT